MTVKIWTDVGGCGTCQSCGMDMDMEPYCVKTAVLDSRKKVTGRDYPYGLDIGPAWELCQGREWEQREVSHAKGAGE